MSTPYAFVRENNPDVRIELERVSNIVAVIGKDGIPHWYAKIVARGAAEMMSELGEIPTDPDEFWKQLKKAKATPWYETKKAQERGTAVHEYLERWLTIRWVLQNGADVPEPPEELAGYVAAGKAWVKENVEDVAGVEQEAYCFCHRTPQYPGIAGTVDLVYRSKIHVEGADQFPVLRGALRLADWKTSKDAYDGHHYQIAGYEHHYEQTHGIRPSGKEIVLLREDGTYRAVQGTKTQEDWFSLVAFFNSLKGVS